MTGTTLVFHPTDTLLISYDFTQGMDNMILLVGRRAGELVEVINTFEGEKARTLFEQLTAPEQMEG